MPSSLPSQPPPCKPWRFGSLLSLHYKLPHAVPLPTCTTPTGPTYLLCLELFQPQKSEAHLIFLRFLRHTSCTAPQTAGKPGILETVCDNLICASLFTQGKSYLTSSCGKLLNHSMDSRALQPQPLPQRLCSTGERDNQCNQGLGIQLPHSYFTPSFDFILYLYFFNIIEYNLFYIMCTNYITMLYRAKHELHGKNWEKNDDVL